MPDLDAIESAINGADEHLDKLHRNLALAERQLGELRLQIQAMRSQMAYLRGRCDNAAAA